MCPERRLCLLADYCLSKLSIYNSNYGCLLSTKWTASSSQLNEICSCHDKAKKTMAHFVLDNNNSLEVLF